MAPPPQTLINENQVVGIRRATPADAELCGRIGFDAFTTLATKHNFPPDFPGRAMPLLVAERLKEALS